MYGLPIPANMAGGLLCALLAVLLGTRISVVGWRSYALIVMLSLLLTGAAVEMFLTQSALLVCCLTGFGLGLASDNLILTLEATLPEFVEGTIKDVLSGIRDKIRKLLGK